MRAPRRSVTGAARDFAESAERMAAERKAAAVEEILEALPPKDAETKSIPAIPPAPVSDIPRPPSVGAFAEPSTTEAPEAPEAGPELDSTGAEWDATCHAANRSKTKSGAWKAKRGLNKAAAPAVDPLGMTAYVALVERIRVENVETAAIDAALDVVGVTGGLAGLIKTLVYVPVVESALFGAAG